MRSIQASLGIWEHKSTTQWLCRLSSALLWTHSIWQKIGLLSNCCMLPFLSLFRIEKISEVTFLELVFLVVLFLTPMSLNIVKQGFDVVPTSFTWSALISSTECTRARASDMRISASSCRTVMRYADLLPGAASSLRNFLYELMSKRLACQYSTNVCLNVHPKETQSAALTENPVSAQMDRKAN